MLSRVNNSCSVSITKPKKVSFGLVYKCYVNMCYCFTSGLFSSINVHYITWVHGEFQMTRWYFVQYISWDTAVFHAASGQFKWLDSTKVYQFLGEISFNLLSSPANILLIYPFQFLNSSFKSVIIFAGTTFYFWNQISLVQ